MKSFVLKIDPGDFVDGKLTGEGKARARDQLVEKFKEDITERLGVPAPDGPPPPALLERIERAIEEALSGQDHVTIATLGLSTMLEACKSAQDAIEAIPEGILLTARALASDGANAKTLFELGEVGAQFTLALATLHVAASNLQHLIECDCSEVGKKDAAVSDATPDTTPEATARA